MRKAQLNVPGEGAPAEVTFFHFWCPGRVGGFRRMWTGGLDSFGMPKHRGLAETYGKTPVTIVRASGTFQSGMPRRSDNADAGLCAAWRDFGESRR